MTGNVKVISDDYEVLPDEIRINGINQSEIKKEYYLNDSESNITLIWYTEITITSNMFKRCSDITEINLSNFDTSNVINMFVLYVFWMLFIDFIRFIYY